MTPASQRGVALMTALVLMALAATIATAIGFSSGLTAKRSAAVFSVEQGVQFAAGAEALAAYVLREDPNVDLDLPTDPWARSVGPIEIAPEIALQAQMRDEQALFNLNTLVDKDGKPDADAVKVFARLLELAELEPRWTMLVVDWIDGNIEPDSQGGEDSLYLAQDPPFLTANLPITSVSELLQLPGFGIERYRKIRELVTALPPTDSQVNVCTAPALVLDALLALSPNGESIRQFSTSSEEEFAKLRSQPSCFPGKQDFAGRIGQEKAARFVTEGSHYFRLTSMVRIGSTQFALYSLMYRDLSKQVRPILRSFGTE
jgi:general secretion pathway protein K